MNYSDKYIEACLEDAASVLKGLPADHKELLNSHHHYFVFRKGETIIKEGDKLKGLLYLVSGKLKVYSIGVGGREQIISMIKQGSFFGFNALFSENRQMFTVSALESSTVCVLEKNTMLRILKLNGDISLKIMSLITEELSFSNNRMVSLSQKHVRGRIAESLLILCNTYGFEADGKTLKARLSRDDLAHFSNMTTSNAIRTLSAMASEGLLKVEGRKITLSDIDLIGKISELG